jgi:hypothetical protein
MMEDFSKDGNEKSEACSLFEALLKIQFRCECFIEDGRSMKLPSIEAIKAICDGALEREISKK